jgi:nucleoside-diphosphate-sugar epimerase
MAASWSDLNVDIISRIFVTGASGFVGLATLPEVDLGRVLVLGRTLSEAGLLRLSRVTVGVDIIC